MTKYWSVAEKNQLLICLQKYGPSNVESIAKELPNKTAKDVRQAIKKYKDLAAKSLNEEADGPVVPLNVWIQIMKDLSSKPDEINVLARTMKYIALFEIREEHKINLT